MRRQLIAISVALTLASTRTYAEDIHTSWAFSFKIFQKYFRHRSVSERFPKTIEIKFFNKALVDGSECEWHDTEEAAETMGYQYNDIGWGGILEINCEGMKPFYLANSNLGYPNKELFYDGDIIVSFRKGSGSIFGFDDFKLYTAEKNLNKVDRSTLKSW